MAMLLGKGANVNAKDNDGYAALLRASNEEHTELVAMLVEKGADVNAKINDGWSALIRASHNPYIDQSGHRKSLVERRGNISKSLLVYATFYIYKLYYQLLFLVI